MQPKMRRDLPGSFMARSLGDGAWRLSRSEPTPIDVFVRGADSDAAEVFRPPDVRDIGIEWRPQAAVLTVTSAGQIRTVATQGIIVHEPLAHLYEAVPLARLDAKARRFWRRVFRLVRIPGGRYLLGIVARRRAQR
jgi:hypothetical protein